MLWPPPYEMPVDAERVGLGDALVDEQAEQVLRVVRLVALVGEVDPAARAAGVVARRRRAARVAEPARRVVDDRVALLREADVVVVVGGRAAVALGRGRLEVALVAALAVQHRDRRERAVAGRRQRHVDVERDAVEGRHALVAVGAGQKRTPFCGVQVRPSGSARRSRRGRAKARRRPWTPRRRQVCASSGASLPQGCARTYQRADSRLCRRGTVREEVWDSWRRSGAVAPPRTKGGGASRPARARPQSRRPEEACCDRRRRRRPRRPPRRRLPARPTAKRAGNGTQTAAAEAPRVDGHERPRLDRRHRCDRRQPGGAARRAELRPRRRLLRPPARPPARPDGRHRTPPTTTWSTATRG